MHWAYWLLIAGALLYLYRTLKSQSFLHRTNERHLGLNVLITGGTKGYGLALAKEFIKFGDNVIVTSRDAGRVTDAIDTLRQYALDNNSKSAVYGFTADVGDYDSLESAAKAIYSEVKRIDFWINNAGRSQQPLAPLTETSPDTIRSIVNTNLLGTLYGCRIATELLSQQDSGGHVFNVDGAGANNMTTLNFATYGATKRSVGQLTKTLNAESKAASKERPSVARVTYHELSPGMVLTELLVGATVKDKTIPGVDDLLSPNTIDKPLKTLSAFNVLAETPETSAAWAVPRMRAVRAGSSESIKFLVPLSVVWRFMTKWRSTNKFFRTK